MSAITTKDLENKLANVSRLIGGTQPGVRHHHLSKLHELVGDFARAGTAVPPALRQLQEDLTNEAIESRFDNMPV